MSSHAGPKLASSAPITSFDVANKKIYSGSGTSLVGLGVSLETGSITGAPTYNNNGYFSFNGTGQFIDCGTNKITGSSAFALTAWCQTTAVNKYSAAISLGTSVASSCAYLGTVATAQLGTSNSIGGGFYGQNIGTGVTTTNTWVYLAMTYAGGANGLVTFYVNGSSVYSVASGITPTLTSTSYKIGRLGTDTIYDWSGLIAVTRVYNKAISAAEIAQNFRALRGRFGL